VKSILLSSFKSLLHSNRTRSVQNFVHPCPKYTSFALSFFFTSWMIWQKVWVEWYVSYDGVRLTSQNCGLYGLIFLPGWFVMWTMVRWYSLRLTLNLSTRALWQPPVLSGCPAIRDISGASGRVGKGNENSVSPSLWDFQGLLHAVKSYDMGPPALLPIRKECVLWIFIPLARLEAEDFGSSDKYTNHYTSKATEGVGLHRNSEPLLQYDYCPSRPPSVSILGDDYFYLSQPLSKSKSDVAQLRNASIMNVMFWQCESATYRQRIVTERSKVT
jgi:hypothetical protein